MVTAKLFVVEGALLHDNCGDLLAPLQPKVLAIKLSVNWPLRSLLFSVKVCETAKDCIAITRQRVISGVFVFIAQKSAIHVNCFSEFGSKPNVFSSTFAAGKL